MAVLGVACGGSWCGGVGAVGAGVSGSAQFVLWRQWIGDVGASVSGPPLGRGDDSDRSTGNLIKVDQAIGLNIIAQSFHTMPSTTGMATTITPEYHHLGRYSRVQATARDATSSYLNAVSYTQQDRLLCLGKVAAHVLIPVSMRGD